MRRAPLFSDGPAEDPIYEHLRDSDKEFDRQIRRRCETLWEKYSQYADNEFLTEIRKTFHARYWETYLTVCFIEMGFEVECLKPGPDIGIKFNGHKIWIEATTPTNGDPNSAHSIPKVEPDGTVYTVPNEKILLRYTNSIDSKIQQYKRWVDKSILSDRDPFVIALNPKIIDFEYADTNPPRLLQTVFAIGAPYVSINPQTLDMISSGYQQRTEIVKGRKQIETALFLRDEYKMVSAALCSRIDVSNQPPEMGADFELAFNPLARNPLPHDLPIKGNKYIAEHIGGRKFRINL